MKKITNFKPAFSLMEMMVVLLIISIVAAASAPMISKKLARNAEMSDSPWVYPNLGDSIAYNMRGSNVTAMIGASTVPNGANRSRVYIETDGEHPSLAFGSTNNLADVSGLSNIIKLVTDTRLIDNGGARIGISNATLPAGTVALGTHQTIGRLGEEINTRGGVVVGVGSEIGGNASVAIGTNVKALNNSIAIGGSVTRLYVASGPYTYTTPEGELKEGGNGTAYDAFNEADAIRQFSEDERNKHPGCTNFDFSNISASLPHEMWTNAQGKSSIALGRYAQTSPNSVYSIAIGYASTAGAFDSQSKPTDTEYTRSLAVGSNAQARNSYASAFGYGAIANNAQASAFGSQAKANYSHSTAIGAGAEANASNQIVLGTSSDTVYIPGNIVVMGNVLLGGNGNSRVYLNASDGTGNGIVRLTCGASDEYMSLSSKTGGFLRGANGYTGETSSKDPGDGITSTGNGIGSIQLKNGYGNVWFTSDKRLKNVGEKYKAGLAELKKLDFYNYTFKKDGTKTPQIGVMAQDLQKVFPTAVREGEDGYLRIRWDEMFYAVINAVKELDTKITAVVEQVKTFSDKVAKLEQKIEAQEKTISEQQKAIKELQKQNAEFDKRLKKLEAKG